MPIRRQRLTPRAIIVAPLLLAAGCSSALSPEDPADIGSWMELYEVPGVSVAVIKDFELDYVGGPRSQERVYSGAGDGPDSVPGGIPQ